MLLQLSHDMNTLNEKQNKRYKRKYKYLKLRIRSLILENAALCDEVAKIQESILIVKDERKFLLRKLLEYEHDMEVPVAVPKSEPTFTPNGNVRGKTKKRPSLDENSKSIVIP